MQELVRRKSSIRVNLYDNIFDATKRNDAKQVKKLLELSCSPNQRDQNNWTPLHYSCTYNNIEVTKILLDNNADVSLNETNNKTPLHYACSSGYMDIISLLIDNKADVNCKDIHSRTPLHSLFSNSMNEKNKLISYFVEKGVNTEIQDNNGETILHLASKFGDTKAIKLLLSINNNLLNISDNQNQTPLHKATFIGNINAIQLLLDSNAEVNAKDKNGKTPLHYTSFHRKKPVVKLLLEYNGSLSSYDKQNKTPIQMLAERESITMLTYLLDRALTAEYQGICYDTLSPSMGSWLIRRHVTSPTTKYLKLNGTQLDWLPQSDSYWQSFQELIEIDLSDNQLQSIPTEILRVPNLQLVKFDKNPLLDFPLFAKKNWNTLRKHLHNLHKDAIEWQERKIIIVGPSCGGKTSVHKVLKTGRKLRTTTYTPSDEVSSSEGISFSPYLQRILNLSSPYIFSIWDICENRELFPLHQCFLTSNSIYLLIFDITKWQEQRTSVDTWVQQIIVSSCNSSQTPIIFAGTHRDCIPPKLVEQEIENFNLYIHERYPTNRYRGIIDQTFVLSCRTREGFDELQEQFEQLANQFQSIGSAQWKRVHDHLQYKRNKQKTKILPFHRYLKVCEVHGIKEKLERNRLTQFLQSIGTIDYFEDNDGDIKDTVILDSPWLSKKVSELIREGTCKGKEPDLEYVIKIAEQLGVIYIQKDGTIITPITLPANKPSNIINYWKDSSTDNYFEYGRKLNFGFLPDGFFSRIIARILLIENIECISMWKYGLIIKYNNQTASIKHTPVLSQHVVNEIDIYCQISNCMLYNNNPKEEILNPKELLLNCILTTIRNLINCYFPYLNTYITEWIPCFYCIEEKQKNPYYFHITTLKYALEHNKSFVYCNYSHSNEYHKPLWIPHLIPDYIPFKQTSIWNEEKSWQNGKNKKIKNPKQITPEIKEYHNHTIGFKTPISFYNTDNQYINLVGEINHNQGQIISCLCPLSNNIIWIGYNNGIIGIHQIIKQKQIYHLSATSSWFAHLGCILTLCYITIHGEEFIWSSGEDGVLRIWNAITTIQQKAFTFSHEISCIKVTNNGNKHIKIWTFAKNDSYITVWDPINYSQQRIQLDNNNDKAELNEKIICMEIHNDYILVGKGKLIYVISIISKKLIGIWDTNDVEITGLHSVIGTNILLSWSLSPVILVWYMSSYNDEIIIEGCELTGHKTSVSKCCTLNLKKQVYIWSCDIRGQIIIWDPAKLEPLLSLVLRGKNGNKNILVRNIFTIDSLTMITSEFCESLDSCVSFLYSPTTFLKQRVSIDYSKLEFYINNHPNDLFDSYIAPGEKDLINLESKSDFKTYISPLINLIINLAKDAINLPLSDLLIEAEYCTEFIRLVASLISNDDMLAGDLVLPIYIYAVTMAIHKKRKEFSVFHNLIFLQYRFLSFGDDNDACQLTHIIASAMVIPNLFDIRIIPPSQINKEDK